MRTLIRGMDFVLVSIGTVITADGQLAVRLGVVWLPVAFARTSTDLPAGLVVIDCAVRPVSL